MKILKYKEKKRDIIFLIIKRKEIIEDVIDLKKISNINKFKFVQLSIKIAHIKFETKSIKQKLLNTSNNSSIAQSLAQQTTNVRFSQIKREKTFVLIEKIILQLSLLIVSLQ